MQTFLPYAIYRRNSCFTYLGKERSVISALLLSSKIHYSQEVNNASVAQCNLGGVERYAELGLRFCWNGMKQLIEIYHRPHCRSFTLICSTWQNHCKFVLDIWSYCCFFLTTNVTRYVDSFIVKVEFAFVQIYGSMKLCWFQLLKIIMKSKHFWKSFD